MMPTSTWSCRPALGDLGDEGVVDLEGAGEHAGGAGADGHPAPAVGARGDADLDAVGGDGSQASEPPSCLGEHLLEELACDLARLVRA